MATEISNIIVLGMTCSHCENSIKKAVDALNGVDRVLVDLTAKKVTVEYDPERVSIQTIRETIEDQGYEIK